VAVISEEQSLRLRRQSAKAERNGQSSLSASTRTIVCRLNWGLGDVLLSTSAISALKMERPDIRVLYQTFLYGRQRGRFLEYAHGTPAELLAHNPDIEAVLDPNDHIHAGLDTVYVDFHYAGFGEPPLDYPIQAHFYENLGLGWQPGQRFESRYYVLESEAEWARQELWRHFGDRPVLVISPHTNWAGKAWRDDAWQSVIQWCGSRDIGVAVLGGAPTNLHPARGMFDFSGLLNWRQNGAILHAADQAVLLEGALSNLRFALRREAILLTCATRSGLQVWTPPELTTEIRMGEYNGHVYGAVDLAPDPHDAARVQIVAACDPCMWRGQHLESRRSDIPPASISRCPPGRSLRDLEAEIVIETLRGKM
jgi:hypothetical protein